MSQLYGIILSDTNDGSYLDRELGLDDNLTPFQHAFLSLSSIVNDKNIITTACINNVSDVQEQLKSFQEKYCRKSEYKLLTVPTFNNTAVSSSMALKYVYDNLIYFSSDMPIFIVVPCDKFFKQTEWLEQNIEKSVNLAKNGYIVSFGVQTSVFSENTTYFKARKNAVLSQIDKDALKVSQFINSSVNFEDTLKKGKIYANTGIYMFRYDTYMSELKKNEKEIYNYFKNNISLDTIPSLDNVSIEKSVISNSKKTAMIEINSEWENIENFSDTSENCSKDNTGNLKQI